ncbi:hypothetical protein BV22DRAFT_1049693 [Leucogyrophana mollusca]|uniref:Uncharacterized protein n=1 Tax=Leucogyrophana mollusca TaxID=85980 RepID=A0ACB8B8Y0_9AGAM|nr:hypothetical protein BV22DRAFT_1049693 [Leucogyrophana mollusca]
MKPVVNGIPQGCPTSPILPGLYAAEILVIFDAEVASHQGTESHRLRGERILPLLDRPTAVHLVMFADDGKLYVSSDSLHTNVRLLWKAYDTTETWLACVGLSPGYVKRELDGTDIILRAEGSVRWLGVYFDRKLTFDSHVKKMAARGASNAGKYRPWIIPDTPTLVARPPKTCYGTREGRTQSPAPYTFSLPHNPNRCVGNRGLNDAHPTAMGVVVDRMETHSTNILIPFTSHPVENDPRTTGDASQCAEWLKEPKKRPWKRNIIYT